MRNLFRKADKDSVMAGTADDKSLNPGASAFRTQEVARTDDRAPTRDVGTDIRAAAPPPATQAKSRLSVVGSGLSFKGMLSADEDLLIQGRVEGSISHHGTQLTIGPRGLIEADISARRILVQGTVHGDLHATELVVLEPSAQVRGNISAPSLGIGDGARFEGSIDMESSETGSASRAKPKVGSGKAGAGEGRDALGESGVHRLLDQVTS